MTREYELKRRAAQMEDTRRRIVEAAIELHETVGPARTSVSAIAERAGVQRQTYYRHFPDERSLFEACSGGYMERNPLPDPKALQAISDGDARLRHGLTELYAYYRANERMLAGVLRDAEVHELTRDTVATFVAPWMAEFHNALADALQSETDSPRLAAALDLALDFQTWRLLTSTSNLSDQEAVTLIEAILRCVR